MSLSQTASHASKLKPALDAPNSLGGRRVLKPRLTRRLWHSKPIHQHQMGNLLRRASAQAQQFG